MQAFSKRNRIRQELLKVLFPFPHFFRYQIRDNHEGEDRGAANEEYGKRETNSTAFSILCIILTILYAGFAGVTLAYANDVIDECASDDRVDEDDAIMMTSTRNHKTNHFSSAYDGYIGERFDVVGRSRNGPGSFVSTTSPNSPLG